MKDLKTLKETTKNLLFFKSGKVNGLESGLIVSDPEFGRDVPYRFETIYDLNKFYAAVKIDQCEDLVDYDGDTFSVGLLKATIGLFRLKKNLSIFSTTKYDAGKLIAECYSIGVDSSHLYFGGRDDIDLAAEGICVGGDGSVGYVIEFKDILDKSTEGILVELEFPDDIIDFDELKQEIFARFHIATV